MNPVINRDFNPGGAFYATRRIAIGPRVYEAGEELDSAALDALGPTNLRVMWQANKLTQVKPNKDAVRAAKLEPPDLAEQVIARHRAAASADVEAERLATAPGPRDRRDVRDVVAAEASAPPPTEMTPEMRALAQREAEEQGKRLFRAETTKPLPGVTRHPAAIENPEVTDADVTSAETPSGKSGGKVKK